MKIGDFLRAMTCAIIFSTGYIISGIIGKNVPPACMGFFRFLFTVMAYAPFVDLKEVKKITARQASLIILAGLCGMFLYNLLMFQALKETSVINISLISATVPVITVLISSLVLRHNVKLKELLSLVISFVGVALVITKGSWDVTLLRGSTGDLLMLSGVVCWALYSVIIKVLGRSYPPLFIVFSTSLVGAISLFFAAISAGLFEVIYQIPSHHWLGLVHNGVIGTALPFLLYTQAVRSAGPSKTAFTVFSTVPIFSAISCYLFLGQVVDFWQVVGGVLVIWALFLNR